MSLETMDLVMVAPVALMTRDWLWREVVPESLEELWDLYISEDFLRSDIIEIFLINFVY